MTNLQIVNKIKKEIEELPEEYQKLILAEKNYVQKHPVIFAGGMFGAGYISHFFINLVLKILF